jgi:hypothetical protein
MLRRVREHPVQAFEIMLDLRLGGGVSGSFRWGSNQEQPKNKAHDNWYRRPKAGQKFTHTKYLVKAEVARRSPPGVRGQAGMADLMVTKSLTRVIHNWILMVLTLQAPVNLKVPN